jgi:hypothetical protein
MRGPPKTPALTVFVIVISAAMAIVRAVRLAAYISVETQAILAYGAWSFSVPFRSALHGF